MPRVTVLMPVFNGSKFIEYAINSVLNQTYADFEFLIINDGSIDNSESIIKSFNDNRINLISYPINTGLVNVLNNGIRLAKGDLVARMDADDIMLPTRLEKQVDYFNKHNTVDILGSQISLIDDTGKIIGERIYALEHDEIKLNCLFHCPMAHPSVMFRKDKMINNHLFYNNDQCFTEDYELWQRASKILKFGNLNEKLLQYRISTQQVSNLNNKQQNTETRALRITFLQTLNILDLTDEDHFLFLDFLDDRLTVDSFEISKRLFFILHKVLTANKTMEIFNQALLIKMFICRLDRVIRIYTNKKNKLFSIYNTSQLYSSSALNLQSKIKLICKQWIK